MKDDEVTWVLTKLIFFLNLWFWEVQNSITHSESFLPELNIQYGFRKFDGFCKILGSISIDSTLNFAFVSICTIEDTRTRKSIDFTPDVEYEVISEAI